MSVLIEFEGDDILNSRRVATGDDTLLRAIMKSRCLNERSRMYCRNMDISDDYAEVEDVVGNVKRWRVYEV